jgi:hypothetical protein
MKTDEEPTAVLLLWQLSPQQWVAQPSPFRCQPRLLTYTFFDPAIFLRGGKQPCPEQISVCLCAAGIFLLTVWKVAPLFHGGEILLVRHRLSINEHLIPDI